MKISDTVVFHTVDGDRAAIVCGHRDDSEDHTLVAVFRGPDEDGEKTGLTGDVNYRWTHAGQQAGEVSP